MEPNNDIYAAQLRAGAVQLDPEVLAFYLRVPRSQVVLLQAYFELYDGVGTVRTINDPDPVLVVMTTTGMMETRIEALIAIRQDVDWEIARLQPQRQ